MFDMDYSKLGFKCGLEIHGQLDVGKLFCECEGRLRKDNPDFTIQRKMRAMAGETGKVDAAAAHAQAKGLNYIYEGYEDTTCLVELDEEPPHTINQKALDIALTIATILHCHIPDYVQVMRKTVVDGSNTSAFQRTVMIATDGYIEINGKKVDIIFIGLEEDAARRTSETKDSVTFRLDRLGIPLLEVVTGPNISTPEEAKELALKIGRLYRATGKAMRGIGTIRQDVNVSIKSHPRVEIKGFQELRQMPETIKQEIRRQKNAIERSEKLEGHVRNAKPDFSSKYLRPMSSAARMYPETDLPLIEISPKILADIKKNIPELPDKKLARLMKAGLSEELASQVLFSKLFDELHKKFPDLSIKLLATTILSTQKEAKKKVGLDAGTFTEKHFAQIFSLFETGNIAKEAILELLVAVAKGEIVLSAAKRYQLLSTSELKKEITGLKHQFRHVPEDKLKGIIIGKLRGKARIQDIMGLL
jgi:Glu-tRNA(Gln) amidotransferase subunit E-like FAD-binding protein